MSYETPEEIAPVIGIVPSLDTASNSANMPNRYVEAIIAAGGAPVALPLTADIRVYETLLPLMDGFLLTGGQDISPKRYSAQATHEKLSELTPEREEVECLALSYAYEYDIPVLGICRGMQVINVFFGGTLYLDLAEQFAKPTTASEASTPGVEHWQKDDYAHPTHFVNIVRASKLGEILHAEQLATNSMHHQGIRDLSPLLDATAYGPDGLIEAVEARDRSFIMGVQWHPEFFAGNKRMGCLFSSLVEQARKARAKRCPAHTHKDCRFRIRREDVGGPWPVVQFAEYI